MTLLKEPWIRQQIIKGLDDKGKPLKYIYNVNAVIHDNEGYGLTKKNVDSFADKIKKFMNKCREILIPELNYEGQLANLIGHLHRKEVKRFNRVTGIPMTPVEILEVIEKISPKK